MYFSQITVDRVVQSVPEIFNFSGAQAEQYAKKTKTDENLSDEAFPVEPVLWPDTVPVPDIRGYRGHGAIALVEGNNDGLVVTLGTGVPYESFMERKVLIGTMAIKAQSGTVLSDLGARCLWPNVADNVRAPSFGQKSAAAELAAMQAFVKDGKHVEGVAARLVALGLEHCLVPFTQRSRIRNANACYWCTTKYRSDGILYSLQTLQAIDDWSSPGKVGDEQNPTAVVWVGDAQKTRGMAILSRIMDRGGPIYLQESLLGKQFDDGRLLMVGTGTLRADLRPVQPADLLDAIDEALWILVTYNNLDVSFIKNALRLLIRNLPIMDRAHLDEFGATWWRVRSGVHGTTELGAANEAALERQVVGTFGAQALARCGLGTAARRRGALSDLFRGTLHAPGAGMDGLAPFEVVDATFEVTALLAALQQPALGNRERFTVHQAVFDPAAPVPLPNIPPQRHVDVQNLYGVFTGRCGFHIFGYSQPPAAGVAAPVVPPGWQNVVVDPGFGDPPGLAPGGVWMEWIGGNDAVGNPYIMGNDMRRYRIMRWTPAAHDAFLPGYVHPPAPLRKFKVRDEFRLAVTMAGAWPDLDGESKSFMRYVNANSRGGDPLDYLHPDAANNFRGLTIGQRSLLVLIGVGYLWDAAHIGRTQNDAYGRWVRERFQNEHLTTIPDELKLYLGGVRSRRYVEACGGLWTLCVQETVTTTKIAAGHEATFDLLKDRSQVASYILKLRCAVEMADVMANASNARLTGCAEPNVWPVQIDDRLTRGRIDHMTVVDQGAYLSLQALLLTAVFDHSDAVIARTFSVVACSTFRLREPVRGGAYDDGAIQHMNWLAPQVLSLNTWTNYYGVMGPTFVPDRVGQSWLRDARYTTAWNDVAPHFEPGVFIDRADEIWSAILTGFANTGWYPATATLVQYGHSLQVDISNVRRRQADRYLAVQARLALPYEWRMGSFLVQGVDVDSNLRPMLPCDGQGGFLDGRPLPVVRVELSQQGRVTNIRPAQGCSVVDPQDTLFASEGIALGRYSPSRIVGPYPETNRSTGQFWISTVKISNNVAAGMSAGGQRLCTYMMPPAQVNASDSGHGDLVQSATVVAADKPNVERQVNPGDTGINVGDVPIHEINVSDAITLVSGLTSMSDADRALVLGALAKGQLIKQSGGTVSTASTSTESTPSGTRQSGDRAPSADGSPRGAVPNA